MPFSYKPAAAAAAATILSLATTAAAGFSTSSTSNVAIYWGQNSYGAATGASNAQQRLSYYCSNTNIDIIPLAFLNVISNPAVNFANAGDNCTAFSGSTLLDCPQLEEDIQTCQTTYGKTIMLSIGGATYTEGGFSSSAAAVSAADNIWAMFGPAQASSGVNRPFGTAVVDGFDFDFESSTSNMAPFASELRSKMDAATAAGDKPYYLSAAPQCPYPDAADNDMLAGAVAFDFVMVQFYNNYCGVQSFTSGSSTQSNFNFATWDNWAKTVSKNPNVRILLGVPGSSTAAGSGYLAGSSLAPVISYSKQYTSFGGVMVWDMSQAQANTGFLDEVVAGLGSGSSPVSPTTTTSTTSRSSSSSTTPTTTSPTTTSPTTTSPTTTSPTTTSPTTTPTTTSTTTPTTTSTTTSTTSSPSTSQSSASPYSSTTTITISATATLTKKTTRPSQSSTPTTFSTRTRSTGTSSLSDGHAGSCAPGPTTTETVTKFVTVTGAAHQASSSTTSPTTTVTSTTTSSTATASATKLAKQWDQCGGIGFTGPTQCAPPYSCVSNSVWWAQCQ